MQEEIIEGNKLIAEFMGAKLAERNGELAVFMLDNCPFPEYFRVTSHNKYHSSWDVLMPVVEKIENEIGKHYSVETYRFLYGHHLKGQRYYCIIHDAGDALQLEVQSDSKIEAVWICVTEFIKWYNKNSKA